MKKATTIGIGMMALAGVSDAAEVGRDVVTALRGQASAQVIVALREPGDPRESDLTKRMAGIEAARRRVLGGLRPSEFRPRRPWTAVSALSGDVTLEGLATLAADPDVVRIDLELTAHAHLARSVPMIRADQVQAQGLTGKGVVIAVIDTGVDASHPDLAGDILDQACFCSSAGGAGCCPNGARDQVGPGAAADDNGHGTHLAGTLTGDGQVAPRGVAPDAEIVAIKVLDKGASGSATGILSALDYLLTRRPEVRVVNMSLGFAEPYPGQCDTANATTMALASSIGALRARGTIVFASTGNGASGNAITAPACVSSAVAVGGVYVADTGSISGGCTDATTTADQVFCFSNSSSAVDILAPGGPITAAALGGGTATLIGTSQAVPHAAGAAAILLEAKPGLTPAGIEAALKGTGPVITDAKNGMQFHRVDVKAAVDASR